MALEDEEDGDSMGIARAPASKKAKTVVRCGACGVSSNEPRIQVTNDLLDLT